MKANNSGGRPEKARRGPWAAFGAAVVLGSVLLAAGCRTPAPAQIGRISAVIGRPVEEVVARYPGRRIEYYDAQGQRVGRLPGGEEGSVSVYLPDGEDGQDNYTVDGSGIITTHQRSYGENYQRGAWEVVESAD